jgi:hypothetical protein
MWFSPELQRNLWLQLSWGRALAAPILFGIVVAALIAALKPSPNTMAEFARWGFVLLLAFWSTRRVADALAEEVGGGTWEGQRMSGLSAWAMMWGKLIGGAIFPWYCALICLGVMVWYGLQAAPGEMRVPLWQQVATLLLGGVLGQATSLTIALLLLRKALFRRRLAVTLAQMGGLLAFGLAVGWDYNANPWARAVGIIEWFGRPYNAWQFYLVSAVVFTAWALLAVWRLMRAELLYTNRPWAWLLFVGFFMVYVAGFVNLGFEALPSQLTVACYAALALTYLGFFAEAKDPVRYRWGLARFKALHWWRALEFTPLWLVAYVLAIVAGALAIWSIVMGGALAPEETWLTPWLRWAHWFALGSVAYKIAALLLFTLRDMLFLLWLNFGPVRSRADITGLVILAIVYVPLPMVLIGAGLGRFLPAAVPLAAGQAFDLIWPAAEIVAIWLLLLVRWRQATRIEILADDREEPSMR